eukprot:1921478-Heterocapsa_arctica.AAC.1
MDSKSEWCKALGYKIHNIRGDGNCLYTRLGKALEMTGNQVREMELGTRTNGAEPDKWRYLPRWRTSTLSYDNDYEHNNSKISLLWCNNNKWGAQPNHYDLLHPIEEEAKQDKSFKAQFIESHDALNHKCNIEANFVLTYIGRRAKDEVDRGTNITTLNVPGSLMDCEWILENTEDHI